MLTKKQFDILVRMTEKGEPETQRSIAEGTGMSLGVVNKTLAQLTEAGFVKSGTVTPEGLDALEPYRVKRAVIFAAGFGSMVPITLNTPKPLVRVHGKRIIDSLLDAVYAAGIGTILDPKPAAKITARLTRYGSSASSPSGVTVPRFTNPASVSCASVLFTTPSDIPVPSAMLRWVSGSPFSVILTRMSNCFFVSILYLRSVFILSFRLHFF